MANLFSDDFNRADSTNLGASWTERKGDWEISSNTLIVVSASAEDLVHTAAYGTADYSVQATMNLSSADSSRIGGRRVNYATTDSDYYLIQVRQSTADISLYKRISGTFTQLGSTTSITVTASTDYVCLLRMNGTTIEADWEGVNKISVTDSSLSAAGDACCASKGGGYRDNFSVDDLAAGGMLVHPGMGGGLDSQMGGGLD